MRTILSNSMKHKSQKAALLLAALMLCSCGNRSGKADFTKKNTRAPYTYSASPTDSEITAEQESGLDGAEGSVTETTVPPETETTAETTAAAPPKPVTLKKSYLEGHSYTAEGFPKKVYSNSKLKKALDKIDDICSDYGYSISFAYKNMDTGASVMYNQYSQYGTCSTIKAPFCKDLLDEGIDLDDEINISVIWDYDGGKVAKGGYGDVYTAEELIELAITESDNSAYYNLINHYGYTSFNEMNSKLGVNYYLGTGWIFTYASTVDLLKQYEDIYNFSKKNDRGKWLTELMANTDLEDQITAQLSDKYMVAHKYGSDWDQNCYHDCAICYAESPFVLVIMTDQVPETDQSNKVFHRLAEQFDIINEQLVVN